MNIFITRDIMRHWIMTVAMAAVCCIAAAQGDFTWKVDKTGGRELTLTITGKIGMGWKVSMHTLEMERAEGLEATGTPGEETRTTPVGSSVTYTQRFTMTGGDYRLAGYLEYILCTDEMCLAPQTVEFAHEGTAPVTRKAPSADAAEEETKPAAATPTTETRDTATLAAATAPAATDTTAVATGDGGLPARPAWQPVINQLRELESRHAASTAAATPDSDATGGSLMTLFLLAFAGGLLALFTPCVWPVIPLTVSFFIKRQPENNASGEAMDGNGTGDDPSATARHSIPHSAFYTLHSRKADALRGPLLFGASIVVIFLTLGVLMTMLFGANALNQLSTNAVFNVVCFAVLVVFGLSLLGLFELRLPSSWANSLDERSGKATGVISIFLMALTLVVVSFSCTAPVIGLLLVEIASATTADGGWQQLLMPMVGMLGFALALALPFTFFALFPQLLSRMPRSGAWMTHVKVTLGVLELGFALKFLSVADLAYGWHILPRSVFIGVWIVLALGLGIYYLMAANRRNRTALRRDTPPVGGSRRGAVLSFLFSLIPLAFAAYLTTGFLGRPLTLVSAFLPPAETAAAEVFYDYDAALAEARRQGKPVFIDFTGYGCVNCRKMEAAVFTDPQVRQMINDRFVTVQLYVDDRTPLPRRLTVNGRTLRTVGDKWALLESHKFGSLAQPLYVIVTPDGTPLTRSYAYDESVPRFIEWLKEGADAHLSTR